MISTTKRLLINELISTSDEKLKELSLDDPIIESIFEFLEHADNDIELLKLITKKLYELYQTQDNNLRLIVLSFVPILSAIYIRHIHNYYNLPKSDFNSIAILLLCIYNCEIVEQKTGDLKTIDIRLITLTKPSIYHEPNQSINQSVQAKVPTEQLLAKINNPNESRISIFGPYDVVEQLNRGNYQIVCTVLLKVYNQHISEMGQYSLTSLCQFYLRLLRQGTNVNIRDRIQSFLGNAHTQIQKLEYDLVQFLPRNSLQIQFCSEFLTELMRSVYFCLYNDLEDISMDLIDEIAKRASFKLYGDVMLMVNAMKNTLSIKNEDKHRLRRTVNQSISSLNASTNQTNISSSSLMHRKAAITNASFKTRKLPDDIPIVTNTTTTPNANTIINSNAKILAQNGGAKNSLRKSLDSISEDSISGGRNASTGPQTKQRKSVMHLLKELKDKPKKGSVKENGRNSSLEVPTHHHNHKIVQNSISSDGSEHNSSSGGKEMIQMKQLTTNKYIDDDGDEDDEKSYLDDEDDVNEPNGYLARLNLNDDGVDNCSEIAYPIEQERLFPEINEDISDSSATSSKELLQNSNNTININQTESKYFPIQS